MSTFSFVDRLSSELSKIIRLNSKHVDSNLSTRTMQSMHTTNRLLINAGEEAGYLHFFFFKFEKIPKAIDDLVVQEQSLCNWLRMHYYQQYHFIVGITVLHAVQKHRNFNTLR